jgi:hypothetical protein
MVRSRAESGGWRMEDEALLHSEGGVERRGLNLPSGVVEQGVYLFIHLFYLFFYSHLQMSKMRMTSVPELGGGDWLRGQRTAGPATEKTRR